jgi:Uma2 family endonuclease
MDKNKKREERIGEQLVTYDVYAAMPDDGNRYEIFDGTLEMMSPGPSVIHQSVSRDLLYLLKQSCNSDYVIFIAPLDVILSRTNVVQPDLILVHRSRMEIVTNRAIEGAPDLVVEVLSPGSRKRDKVMKLNIYAKHEVPEYWIIDTNSRTLEQYVLDGDHYALSNLFEGDDQITSGRLPCVEFAISDLFKDASIQKLFPLS